MGQCSADTRHHTSFLPVSSFISLMKMICNYIINLLLLLANFSLCTDGEKDVCSPALVDPSPVQHQWAEDGIEVSTIAFSSCYTPSKVKGDTFWSKVRSDNPDIWLWLGDNAYNDGTDMDFKRRKYNEAREEASYQSHGPVKEGAKIPVMATWDDHDSSVDDGGNGFPCMAQSQVEFVEHFSIPKTSPLHREFPGGAQEGVYNSRMFSKPGSEKPGLHVIMLDARYDRDPTFSFHGECQGASTQMLSSMQWDWLKEELAKEAEITVIVSGVQVLQPTDQTKIEEFYCAHDSHSGGGNTFHEAIAKVGEDDHWLGTYTESWGQVPQERARLLGLAQQTLNSGSTSAIVFLSGDQHWGELLAKKMPKSEEFGAEQVLHEVTASGVYADWPGPVGNGNRLREKSANWRGEGPYNRACVFPFIYQGSSHSSCVDIEDGTSWCSTKILFGVHVPGYWGVCAPADEELIQESFSNSTKTCSQSKFHICTAQANYGYLSVDWESRSLKMGVRTPEENEEMYHTIHF